MKAFKAALWFVVGLVLGGAATWASAETTQATYGRLYYHSRAATYNSPGMAAKLTSVAPEACQGLATYFGETYASWAGTEASDGGQYVMCYWARQGAVYNAQLNIVNAYYCPGSSWTLSGSTCSRPDCPSGTTRQADGTCSAPCPSGSTYSQVAGKCMKDCTGKQTTSADGQSCVCDTAALNAQTGSRPWFEGTGAMPSSICDQGCSRNTGFGVGGGDWWGAEGGSFSGAICTGGGASDTPTGKTPLPDKKPPCAASEGVMTSTSGTVACVPEGTLDARDPVIGTKTKVETFPDGSTKTTTENTTRDPATNATQTDTTVTTTPASNGSAGQAGAVGTSTSSSSDAGKGVTGGNGDGDGEDGNCDPREKMCSKPPVAGLYEKKEKTFASVLQTFVNTVKGSALGSATTGFFNVSTPSGSCPSWSASVPYLNVTLNASEYFCNGSLLSALQGAGYVLLALATYIAFTWALL